MSQPGPEFDQPRLAIETRHRFVEVERAVRLHVVETGPPSGPPLLLLHGFPEFWWGWRRQMVALAAAGWRCVAPDQRGYNLSDKPGRVREYSLERLTRDAVALIDDLGAERMAVLGHDWGAVVAWSLAIRYPGRVSRLAVLNAPHPTAFQRVLLRSREQRRRSWYFLFFQIPWWPERRLLAQDARWLRAQFRRTSRGGTFPSHELGIYVHAATRPGAMRAMVNWYRAALRHRPTNGSDQRVECPTLIGWGDLDVALVSGLAEASAEFCRAVEILHVPAAGHFVHHEEPDAVNRRLLEFLAPARATRSSR